LSSSDRFGWALVGPGNIARRFAGAVRGIDGARISAVVGRDAARAAAFAAEQCPGAWAGNDLAAALARPDVQAVYVCTRTRTTRPRCAPRSKPASRCCAKSR
jgi:predicted dehydrogenase